jgi:hypothetical protein
MSDNPDHYKTYTFATPARTHFRWADCEEYQCVSFRFGFKLVIDLTTTLGLAQYDFAKKDKTRSFQEVRTSLEIVELVYPAGTRCWDWRDHRVPVDRPPILVVRGGDWRAYTGLIRRHTRPEDWADDAANHQDGLAKIFSKG